MSCLIRNQPAASVRSVVKRKSVFQWSFLSMVLSGYRKKKNRQIGKLPLTLTLRQLVQYP